MNFLYPFYYFQSISNRNVLNSLWFPETYDFVCTFQRSQTCIQLRSCPPKQKWIIIFCSTRTIGSYIWFFLIQGVYLAADRGGIPLILYFCCKLLTDMLRTKIKIYSRLFLVGVCSQGSYIPSSSVLFSTRQVSLSGRFFHFTLIW